MLIAKRCIDGADAFGIKEDHLKNSTSLFLNVEVALFLAKDA